MYRDAIRLFPRLGVAVLVSALASCTSEKVYENTFSVKTALRENAHTFDASVDRTFKAAKISLVQQGFAIEQASAADGLVNGKRTYNDPGNKKISYLISTTVAVTGLTPDSTSVTVSASQQTLFHQKKKQTVVRSEGDITGSGFYKDLFTAIDRNMPPAPAAIAIPLPPPPPAPVPAVEPPAEVPAPTEAAPPPPQDGNSGSAPAAPGS